MKAEIISIGSELTSGQNLDTNSQWLSRRLAEIGIPVGWHTTVADDLDDNVDAFRIADRRGPAWCWSPAASGPTQDDLTREVLARVAGVELVFDAGVVRPHRGDVRQPQPDDAASATACRRCSPPGPSRSPTTAAPPRASG